MPDPTAITSHYERPDLLNAIEDGIAALGKSPDSVTLDDLSPVDEFHVGGRVATRALMQQLDLDAGTCVLDVGCGIGGAARFVASEFGCDVVGVDLTAGYVQVGNALNAYTGFDARVRLFARDATETGFGDSAFDAAYMLHVGMNIADKAAVAAEVFRVLAPGGTFAIYDLMRIADGALAFPLPWASDAGGSALAAPTVYRRALERAGFDVVAECDRRDVALDVVRRTQETMRRQGGPPPLGLHLLMGPEAPVKYANMVAAIEAGIVAPVEMVARKPGRLAGPSAG